MTDRTVAALASALPAGISYDTGAMGFTGKRHPAWDAARIARFQANILAESGWRLVHDDDRPENVPNRYWDGVDAAAEIVEHYDTPSQAVAALRALSRVGREADPPQTFAEHTAEALALIHTQNVRNLPALNPRNTTGYRGVSRGNGQWRSCIRVDGRTINLGTFDTPEEAARVYDAAAIEHFGEFHGYLNFPEETTGPLDGMAGPVQSPPLVGVEGGLWLEEAGGEQA